MVRLIGLIILVVGLIIVGVSGDNHRVPNGRNISYGAVLMFVGAMVSIFAGQLAMLMT